MRLSNFSVDMSERNAGNVHVVPLPEAATMLQLPVHAVEALVGAGYLLPAGSGPQGPEFPLSDLKAFQARNAYYHLPPAYFKLVPDWKIHPHPDLIKLKI